MKQILLPVEQTNYGELDKGEYRTGGRFFRDEILFDVREGVWGRLLGDELACWRRRDCLWYVRHNHGRESWCMAFRGRGILLELKDELILKIWWRGLNIIVLNINERMWPGVKWPQEATYKRRWNIIKAPKNQKCLNILLLQLGEKGEFMEKEGGFKSWKVIGQGKDYEGGFWGIPEVLGGEEIVSWWGSADCWLWFIKPDRNTMEGGLYWWKRMAGYERGNVDG